MRLFSLALCAGVLCSLVWGQSTPDVGSGAPNTSIQQQFQSAFFRNGFAYQVSLPPLGDVKRLGTNGLVQEFPDSAKTMGVKLALVMPNQSASPVAGGISVLQMLAPVYAYFNSLGVNTVGMPTSDTQTCPALVNSKSCQYQVFDKPYALFVYASGSQFATRDPYYTKWTTLGGAGVLGPAAGDEASVTSSAGTQATGQIFDQGAIYNISSGVNNGRIFAIKRPVFAVYVANGGAQGSLGLPTSEELLQPTGRIRQSFEGGSIEYDPNNPALTPVLRSPVSNIVLSGAATPVKLNLGDSISLQVSLFGADGTALTDRTVTWTTSNSRVLTVQGTGLSAVVKAVGGGSAVIQATSEGKTSAPIAVIVTAPCCQVGDGAPTAAIAQAFADAVARNHLAVKLPAAAAVLRVGTGYIQQFEAADSSGKTYVVAVADRTGSGYVVSGAILIEYMTLGGFGGALGYPIADATAGGRQLFENGALAGSPVQVVTGDILAKWSLLGYESGSAGAPLGAVGNALTFRATRVQSQAFQNATLYAIVTGSTPSKVYASAGAILAKFAALGGPAGPFGAPVNDEYALNGRRRQDFEGGSIDIGPGETEARATATPRRPVVTAAPATALAGTRVRLAVGGFNDGAKVNVSLTGQPDFSVQAANGAYTWEAFVPQNARSGIVTIRAVDAADASVTAQATYAVRALAEAKLKLSAGRGDAQTGVPGALLPLALGIALKDESGNGVPGMPVKFSPSPGAQIVSSSTVTDANGEATVLLRLPLREGVALVTVEAGGQIITLSAKAVASTLANYPKLNQVEGGAMLAASAAILRYHQNRGEMPAQNGPADPAALNQYLKTVCGVDAQSAQVCDGLITLGAGADQIVNLWRLPGFVGNTAGIGVNDATLASVRDAIAAGEPALIALSLLSGDTAIGSHFVSGIGVAADASIVIADPNPAFGRQNLNEYLTGFTAASRPVRGVLTGVARLISQPPSASGFLVAVDAGGAELASNAGPCGRNFGFASTVLRYCEGSVALYELDLSANSYHGALFDLGARPNRIDLPGTGPVALKISQTGSRWTVGPMNTTILPHGVVNAASFDERIAAGGLVTVFGSGFGRDAGAVQIQFNGSPANVVTVTPFQLNVQAPTGLALGSVTMRVAAAAGTAEQPIQVSDAAPALFLMPDGHAAAINMDGSLNSAANPARRGEVMVAFGTGFGSTMVSGAVMRVNTPVTAVLEGASLPVVFAGLTPGFPGLYQANLQIPLNSAPGLGLRLSIQQGNSASNTVLVAVQ
ncbi:MAG TPA: Ig-like domain-containing protein [Bryobacteraceae bacterium]